MSHLGSRVGVGGWGGPTHSDRHVYGWLPTEEFTAAFPEHVEKLIQLDEEAQRGHKNPVLVLSDTVFVVPPTFIAGTSGLERIDLVRILQEDDDLQAAMEDLFFERNGEVP